MNLVVTVPKWFWPEWIEEGDAAGEIYSGEEWGFFLGGAKPPIGEGDRLYIVAHNRLRGYAPVTRLGFQDGKWVICRRGGGVACTIDETIRGFQGFRKVWWQPEAEKPFEDWKTKDVIM
jgi:hypothetical protein